MNFKCALILAAVAFCAVQAASIDDHERNRRDAADLFNKAKSFVSDMKTKITTGAKNAVNKITGSIKNIEESFVKTAQSVLSKVGLNVDVQGLLNTLKGNIKACAISADIKTKALAVKDDLLSCVSEEMKTVQAIIKEVTEFASAAEGAPAIVSKAVTVCKGQAGESFSLARLTECGSALKAVLEEETLAKMPEAIMKNVEKASSIAMAMKNNGAACVAGKVKNAGSTIVDVAKSMASCVVAG